MAPMRVAIAAAAVVLCLLEYGLTADIQPIAATPEATTKIAADTGGTTLLNQGKRQVYGSTTVVATTGVPIATTTERLLTIGKRQVYTTTVAPTGVPTATTAGPLRPVVVGKRQVYGSTTVGASTGVPTATTTGPLRPVVVGKRQVTVVATTGVPIAPTTEQGLPMGKRQGQVYGPTNVIAIDTTPAATVGTTKQSMQKRQVFISPTTTEIVTPTATASIQPIIAYTATPSNQAGKRQAPHSSSHSPNSSGMHDHDHDHDDHHDR